MTRNNAMWTPFVKAKTKRCKRTHNVLAALLLAVTLGPSTAFASNNIATGDEWWAWNNESRFIYVSAYLQGNGRGFRDGCVVGEKIYSVGELHGLPGDRCGVKAPTYSKTLEDYMTRITEYYQKYPEDRIVPIFRVLEGLSDARSLTVEQMHSYFPGSIRK